MLVFSLTLFSGSMGFSRCELLWRFCCDEDASCSVLSWLAEPSYHLVLPTTPSRGFPCCSNLYPFQWFISN